MTQDGSGQRLRTAPRVRFAPQEDVFDLRAAAEQLQHEASRTAQIKGQRQIVLFRHGSMTLALYLFEPGGRLPDHVVDGSVLIHCLDGHLVVATDSARHELPAGTILRMAPGVRHDVSANGFSQMLLTIVLEGPASHAVPEAP